MHLARLATLAIAVLPACRGEERAPIAARDTVTTAIRADTVHPPGGWMPPPNACRYTDTRPRPRQGDPQYGQPYDSAAMAHGVEHRCALRPAGPQVRLVVRGDWGIPRAVDVHSPPEAARPLQRLELDNDERARQGSDLVVGEDLNGDGWTDLRMRTFSGTGGVMYDVFLYAPARRAFVQDTLLSGHGNVRSLAGTRCVETGWRMGMGDWSHQAYCWERGRWFLTRDTYQSWDSGGYYIRTFRERRGHGVQVVRVDTLSNANEGISP